MARRLERRRAVVVGVGAGIGAATAVRCLEEGARVVAAARGRERLGALLRLAEGRGELGVLTADAADPAQVARLVEAATERLGGPPDLLVNAVGAWQASDILTEDPATVRAMLEGNLTTIMTTTPAFARAMKEHGGGVIVNVGAVYGPIVAKRGQAAYNAAKAGVVAYTRSAAAELLPHGIRVNCVMPGGTAHDFAPGRDVAKLRRIGQDAMGVPEDVAAAIVFLASDEAGWITGASLAVDGGDSLGAG